MRAACARLLAQLSDSVLTHPGDTDPALRRAVEARSASFGGRPGPRPGDLPEPVARYVDKTAQHAYKVTDADVEALKQAGYSEDAIFEITLSAALGAAKARVERGMAALRGDA